MALASQVDATGIAPTVAPPAQGVTSFKVAVTGFITAKCTIDTRNATGDFGSITDGRTGAAQEATLSLPFSMACNAPYEATLVSQNGALAYDGTSQPAFASRVDYSAALDMSRIGGGVALRCDSATMRGSNGFQSNCHADSPVDVATAAGDGSIELKLKAGPLPLLKGTYSDKLILRLSPRV